MTQPARKSQPSTIVRGQVGAEGARSLERELRARCLRGERTVIVDITEVDELEPALAGALLRANRSLSWRNARLLVVVTDPLRETLERMGLDEALELLDADAL